MKTSFDLYFLQEKFSTSIPLLKVTSRSWSQLTNPGMVPLDQLLCLVFQYSTTPGEISCLDSLSSDRQHGLTINSNKRAKQRQSPFVCYDFFTMYSINQPTPCTIYIHVTCVAVIYPCIKLYWPRK